MNDVMDAGEQTKEKIHEELAMLVKANPAFSQNCRAIRLAILEFRAEVLSNFYQHSYMGGGDLHLAKIQVTLHDSIKHNLIPPEQYGNIVAMVEELREADLKSLEKLHPIMAGIGKFFNLISNLEDNFHTTFKRIKAGEKMSIRQVAANIVNMREHQAQSHKDHRPGGP